MIYARIIAILQLLFFLGIVVAQDSEIVIQSIEPIKTVLAGGENPIEIKRTIGTFDGINNTLPIIVELKYLGKYPVYIEFIDYLGDIRIINCSGYKIIKKMEDIYNDSKVSTHPVFITPYSIEFSIHNLRPKERVRFSYVIDTSYRNDFLTKTTIRFFSEDGYPDSDYVFKISTMPVFSVNIETKELQALPNKPIYLTYYIKYLGPADADFFNASIDSSDAYILSTQNYHMKIKKGEVIFIHTSIKYKNEGIYSLPGININGINYHFNETITIIDVPTSTYYALLPYWAGLVSIMTLVPAIVAIHSLFKKKNPLIKQRIKKKWFK